MALARYATLLRALCAGLQTHRVVVKHVPRWVPEERLLGDGAWVACEDGAWACELTTREACARQPRHSLVRRLRRLLLGES